MSFRKKTLKKIHKNINQIFSSLIKQVRLEMQTHTYMRESEERLFKMCLRLTYI